VVIAAGIVITVLVALLVLLVLAMTNGVE